MREATMNPSGTVSMKVIKAKKEPKEINSNSLKSLLYHSSPFVSGLDWKVRMWKLKNLPNIMRGLWKISVAKVFNMPIFYGVLSIVITKADGTQINYGLASTRVVTDAGVGFIVDAFQNSVELETMKYHALGTGSTAEAAGDTALVTELTTEYTVNSTRATGTTAENAANIYESVATNTVDATVALREHGVLSQAATGGGVLLDRTLFSAINLVSGDSLASTYRLTLTAGS
jgi:hypothetical protein